MLRDCETSISLLPLKFPWLRPPSILSSFFRILYVKVEAFISIDGGGWKRGKETSPQEKHSTRINVYVSAWPTSSAKEKKPLCNIRRRKKTKIEQFERLPFLATLASRRHTMCENRLSANDVKSGFFLLKFFFRPFWLLFIKRNEGKKS